jgi:hypothetical protein
MNIPPKKNLLKFLSSLSKTVGKDEQAIVTKTHKENVDQTRQQKYFYEKSRILIAPQIG